MDQNISGRAKKGIEKISWHEPEVKRGAMGLLITPFQGTQGTAKNTPGNVILRKPTAPLGTADYRVAATPH